MEAEVFNTQESILALCLTLAGCEPLDPKQPCINLFDAEILAKHGYKGMPMGEAAEAAWKEQKKGHVEYILKRTPRLLDLLRAYRDQCEEIENLGCSAAELIRLIFTTPAPKGLLVDEAILRIACIILKTRGQYVNLWKETVPLLRVPVDGRTKHLRAREGEHLVKKPGFKMISLNASDATRKHMGL